MRTEAEIRREIEHLRAYFQGEDGGGFIAGKVAALEWVLSAPADALTTSSPQEKQTVNQHTKKHSHSTTPAFGVSASPTPASGDWSVTLTFAPQIGWDKSDFLAFDTYLRKKAELYLNAPVGGTSAGPND